METKTLLNTAAFVLEKAKSLGATACDVGISAQNGVKTTVRLGEVVGLKIPRTRSLSLRVFVGDRFANVDDVTDLRRVSLNKVIRQVLAMAKATEPDKDKGLPDLDDMATELPDLDLFDERVTQMGADEAIQLALAVENAARGFDKRINNARGTSCGAYSGATAYGNSNGFLKAYTETAITVGSQIVASENGEMQAGGHGEARRYLSDLPSPDSIGVKAAQSALRQLGARKVRSQVVPVVFDPEVASALLAEFVSAADAEHLFLKTSFLHDKEGKQVAHPSVTIVDNALLARGLGSMPFTADGSKTGVRTIVENGLLKTMLTGTYEARRLGRKPNGGGTTNLSLRPGTMSREEIIASVDTGLYLTQTAGHGGNPVTGNWSLGASGFWIEKGKLAFPVSEITVAGNLLEMFANIEAIGNDPEYGSISAPTLKISGITIGGSES
jgi:PmbA protein